MDEKDKFFELEKAQLRTELNLNSLIEKVSELTEVTKQNKDELTQQRGVMRLSSWAIPLAFIVISGLAGWGFEQYNKTNVDQYSKIDSNTSRQDKQDVINNQFQNQIDNLKLLCEQRNK